jgi:hypothetical protein
MNSGALVPNRAKAADTMALTMSIVSKATSPTDRPVRTRVMASI